MPDKAQDDDVVMSLVDLALARPAGERESYLRAACGGDQGLYQQVRHYVEAEERMGGFLVDPLFPPPEPEHPLEAGEVLDGRFRIVREVAQGGMGVVYEAVDQKLERRVALKCAKTGFRKRLSPEVRNAREIAHPNVCKIFEIHTASSGGEDLDFIVMEFLDGRTLGERLREAPLGAGEARGVAEQLCAGVAEAHRHRVIHGDLKSNNVMLTTGAEGGLRAVITDFGLARRPASQAAPPSMDAGGTPDYMAPELMKGEKASLASDIYALGVLLHELAAGRKPFARDASLEERMTRKTPALRHPWGRVIARCLDPDPAKRYRSAAEVEQALARAHSRRWGVAAAAAIGVALVSGGVVYQPATAPAERVRLAVLPFRAAAGMEAVAAGAFRETSAQVARLRGDARVAVAVVPSARVLAEKVEAAESARGALGATHALEVSLANRGGKVVVRANLSGAGPQVAKEWTAEYAAGELRYVPVALAGFVTGTLRLPPLATSAAVNAAAQKDYLEGLNYLRKNSTVEAGLASLERAVAADPDSPLTHAALGEARQLRGIFTADTRWEELAAESAREAERRNPDLAPVRRLTGLLNGNSGYYEAAARDLQRAIDLEPGNSEGYRRLGSVYERNNQAEEALLMFRKAVEVEPNYFKTHHQLGTFYYSRADYSAAIPYFRKSAALAPDEYAAHYGLAAAYVALGAFPEAEAELRTALSLRETTTSLYELGVVLMYQGNDGDAIRFLQQTTERNPQRVRAWMYLGVAYRRTHQRDRADAADRKGLALADPQMQRDPRNGYLRSVVAYFHARLGNPGRAESEIAQALRFSPNDADALWNAVLTYEVLGKRERTLEILSASPAGLRADLARWPDLADLHKDSRFVQLLAGDRGK
jgi:serine/threonine-protein kinase